MLELDRRHFLLTSLAAADAPAPRKIKDVVIYQDPRFYCAFPSIIGRKDGELITAFRRAPNRIQLGEKGNRHTDSNSYLVLVRSRDNGETWTSEPELLYAHPLGGSQDPCLLQLKDGSILCASYLWTYMAPDAPRPAGVSFNGQFAFQGGYLVRSDDGARTWKGPFVPPPVPGRAMRTPYGEPLPAFNRGALCQGRDGRIYWAVAYRAAASENTEVHLMISSDRGQTWQYSCPIAADPKITFNETSLYETPKGDLVAFLRTANFDDHTVVARSTDNGRSFRPFEDAGWQGHPHHAVRLSDNRVLLAYGYRHKPYGIRARVLDAECADFKTAPEIVLRDDGGSGDLGYPWAIALPGRRALVTYYFNRDNGHRHIAATLLSY